MPGEIRRGSAAIDEALENTGGGGNFKPFLPNIYWKSDKESKYLLFLNGLEEIPQLDMIHFLKDENGHVQSVVAKTDSYFEESTDPLVVKWDAEPKITNLAVAVELEPVMEKVGQRTRPTGFTVATKDFVRKVIDDEGNATDEEEEVTTPVVGLIVQSPYNFFNAVKEYDETESPINETPLKVTRLGQKSNVSYQIAGYDVEVDLSPLFEYLDGVTYLGEDIDTLNEEITDLEPFEAAGIIGATLLAKRIEEFVDEDRYEELAEGVTESLAWDGGKKKASKKDERKAPARKARPSQRRSRQEETDDTPEADEPEADEKPKATRKAKTAKGASPAEKLEALQAKAAAKK
jgi:hypothetical protein